MGKLFSRWGLAALSAGILVAMGCAGDKDLIDRVQPGYVAKKDLKGSWYYRRTVIDAPETMDPYLSIGTGDLFTIERVRWDIQEDMLIAYRDYEYVPGSDNGTDPGADYFGSPVAAFRITRHFDIIMGYSDATGEETNLRVENDSDRVWYDREFVRVDWSRNVSPDLDFILPVDQLDTDNMIGSLNFVHPDDAANPHHARLTPEKGYIDFVNEHFVQPDVYNCYLYYDLQMNPYACGAGEVRVRHAFMKVDKDREAAYQPLEYPDTITLKDADGREILDPATGEVRREPIFERFGYYRLDRLTYDRYRDLTESGRLFRIIRFDIWDRSLDKDGNEIPYAERKVRPINYYLNADFPEDLRETAEEVALEWNQVFRNTVATLQQKNPADVSDVFILNRNSCNPATLSSFLNDHSSVRRSVEGVMGRSFSQSALASTDIKNWCSATEYFSKGDFTWQQNGDPRFNMMYWITERTPTGFSGYGPMLGDPVTGRNVVASAYVMGWTIDSAATKALEYIDYMNGDLTLEQVVSGSNLPYSPAMFAPASESVLAAVDNIDQLANRQPSADFMASLARRVNSHGSTPEARLTRLENSQHFNERLARIRGTELETEFLTRPEDLMLASGGQWRPGDAVSDELRDAASFVTKRQEQRAFHDRSSRFFQERTFCPMADLDDALIGLAKRLKDEGFDREERYQYLRKAIFKAVMLHEVGHNVGLRHNFEGSYDALNFDKQFWDIEEAGLTPQEELEQSQPEYKYSSIMDYHGRVNGDFHGLGRYDNAAIKFGYGQIIETFATNQPVAGTALKDWRMLNDYRKLPNQLGGVESMYNRVDRIFEWDNDDLSAADVEDMLENEVPYMFCSDEYANYTPTCKRFDFGANQREVTQAAIVRYKNYSIFTNFLRNRLVLDFGRVVNRAVSTFGEINMTFQYWYLYQSMDPDFINTDLGKDMAQAFTDGLNLMRDVVAQPEPGIYSRCTYNTGTANEMAVYFPDEFIYFNPYTDRLEAQGDGDSCVLNRNIIMPLGDQALPLFLGFSEDFTAWTFTYIGTYWDKQEALFQLANPYATFFRVNDAKDWRTYSVSPYRVFDKELLNLFNGVIRYDMPNIGNLVNEADLDPEARPVQPLVSRLLIDSERPLSDVGTLPTEPPTPGLAAIYPGFARNLQRTAVFFGNALLTSPLDTTLDFSKHSRVFVKGAMDDLPVFDSLPADEKAECTIPTSGLTYRALATADGSSISYDLVNSCATLASTVVGLQDERDIALANVASAATPAELADAQNELEIVEFQLDVQGFELEQVAQTLQFARLLELVYE